MNDAELTDEQYPRAQAIVDAQYAKWRANANANAEDGDIQMWTYTQFLRQMPLLDRQVCLIGKLAQQVNNGGYGQWDANGYSETADQTLDALLALGTSAGNRAYHLTKAVAHRLGAGNDAGGSPTFDEFDNAFYDINEQLLRDLEAFIARQMPQEVVTG